MHGTEDNESAGNPALLVTLLSNKDNSRYRGGVLSYGHEISSKQAVWLTLKEKSEKPAFNHLDVLEIKARNKAVNYHRIF